MDSILSCLCGTSHTNPPPNKKPTGYQYTLINEKPPITTSLTSNFNPPTTSPTDQDTKTLTTEILSLLTKSPTQTTFQTSLNNLITPQSWSEALATSILDALEQTLQNTDHSTWGDFLTSAYNSAVELAEEEFTELVTYAREHPLEIAATILVSLLAFGVLAGVMPWVLRVVGFAERGIIAG